MIGMFPKKKSWLEEDPRHLSSAVPKPKDSKYHETRPHIMDIPQFILLHTISELLKL